jgi:hypothetical protein
MTRFREVPNFRELKNRNLLLLRDKLVLLDLKLLNFRVQCGSGNTEFRRRTFRTSNFPFASANGV